ncbi:unnamed protein product [Brugia pahangi]|uniref:Uncharacterized protein n=1 Tax=Brugia pahangi TaxID=6280 RepID=A0A0N4SXE1_BRUPA|nr:unnamed protein product [Brugia pahangi]
MPIVMDIRKIEYHSEMNQNLKPVRDNRWIEESQAHVSFVIIKISDVKMMVLCRHTLLAAQKKSDNELDSENFITYHSEQQKCCTERTLENNMGQNIQIG